MVGGVLARKVSPLIQMELEGLLVLLLAVAPPVVVDIAVEL